MLVSSANVNYSFAVSFLYFFNYAITFILFFFVLYRYLSIKSNLHYNITLLKYSKRVFYFYIAALLSFLGVPPFSSFAPKFAALTLSWAFGNLYFYLFLLITVFVSFALYLQVFDTVFKTKFNKTICSFFDFELNSGFVTFTKTLNYTSVKCLIIGFFLILFGFFFFKDFFFLFTLYL